MHPSTSTARSNGTKAKKKPGKKAFLTQAKRVTIVLPRAQRDWLTRRAQARSVSLSHVIREIVAKEVTND